MNTSNVDIKTGNAMYSNFKAQTSARNTCLSKCVVDFQSKDIGVMEKLCARHCLTKQMVVFRELTSYEYKNEVAKWKDQFLSSPTQKYYNYRERKKKQ